MKKRSNYRPRGISLDPLQRITKTPKAERDAVLTRWRTALESIARCSEASRSEIADLADVVNTLETLCGTMGLLDRDATMPLIQDASQALVQAWERHAAHGVARVDGLGLQALRDAVALYEQAAEGFTHYVMIEARRLTDGKLRRMRRNPEPGTTVLQA